MAKKKSTFSLSDDEEEDSTTTTSSGNSQCESADEDAFAKERSGSNLTRKMEELSSGSDCELSDDEDSDGKVNGSQLTLEDGASERKEVLKDATASQKRDKSTGKKKNKDNGGSENVFNARSPDKNTPDTIDVAETVSLTRPPKHHHQGENTQDAVISDSFTQAVVGSHMKSANALSSQSLAKLRATLDKHATPGSVPIRSRTAGGRSTVLPHRQEEDSVAPTEAQLQAKLLRRGGPREFSSRAFDVSDDDDDDEKITTVDPELRVKKKPKHKKKSEDSSFNPVEAEIVIQQARLKAHAEKKMRENPERYFNKDEGKVYELTSDDESGKDRPPTTHSTGASHRTRDAAAPSPSSREKVHEQSVTKKEKKRKKRKRDRGIDGAEENGDRDRKRKRSKSDLDNHLPQDEVEATAMLDDFLGNIQSMAAILSQGMKKKTISSSRKASLKETLTSLSEIDLDETPTLNARDYHKAKNDAGCSTILKSLWSLLPKALLYATMRNLNNANRASLGDKLKLCLKGKQTNPNIRVVKRVDEHGDEIDLLEEYGVISEPDPYTMSSDLTLLTAARSLIVSLSGQRTGLDLSAIADKVIEGRDDFTAVELKQATQDNPGGISPMEEELRRIASERQKEVERLKEENRVLMARLNKSKR